MTEEEGWCVWPLTPTYSSLYSYTRHLPMLLRVPLRLFRSLSPTDYVVSRACHSTVSIVFRRPLWVVAAIP